MRGHATFAAPLQMIEGGCGPLISALMEIGGSTRQLRRATSAPWQSRHYEPPNSSLLEGSSLSFGEFVGASECSLILGPMSSTLYLCDAALAQTCSAGYRIHGPSLVGQNAEAVKFLTGLA